MSLPDDWYCRKRKYDTLKGSTFRSISLIGLSGHEILQGALDESIYNAAFVPRQEDEVRSGAAQRQTSMVNRRRAALESERSRTSPDSSSSCSWWLLFSTRETRRLRVRLSATLHPFGLQPPYGSTKLCRLVTDINTNEYPVQDIPSINDSHARRRI